MWKSRGGGETMSLTFDESETEKMVIAEMNKYGAKS